MGWEWAGRMGESRSESVVFYDVSWAPSPIPQFSAKNREWQSCFPLDKIKPQHFDIFAMSGEILENRGTFCEINKSSQRLHSHIEEVAHACVVFKDGRIVGQVPVLLEAANGAQTTKTRKKHGK